MQRAVLDNIRDTKKCNSIRRGRQKQSYIRKQRENVNGKKLIQNCKYCGTGYLQSRHERQWMQEDESF